MVKKGRGFESQVEIGCCAFLKCWWRGVYWLSGPGVEAYEGSWWVVCCGRR